VSGVAYVALTVVLTVYGQIVTKWRAGGAEHDTGPALRRLRALVRLLFDPWVLSAMVATGVAGVTWLAALDQVQLSVAYPFVAAGFVAVLPLSAWLFGEPLTRRKALGVGLICAGLVLANVG
jgi:multidrug transporter EmrE-like cation transporter